MNKLPKVAIIGGAGPMAGALLFGKIIHICQEAYGCKNDEDFPCIMLYSYPFSDMLKSSFNRPLITNQLGVSFDYLRKNGFEIAVIACNTLHAFLEKGQTKNLSFVHLIQETGSYLQGDQALVLCTSTSAKSQVHKKAFPCNYPESSFQKFMDRLIDKILAGKQTKEDARILSEAVNAIQGDVKGIVLGCTELSVLNEQFPLKSNGLNERFFVADPNQIAAEKLCKIVFKNWS